MEFITYKFHDKKGRRLAVKCEQDGKNVKFTVITCNDKDFFSKKRARNALNGDIKDLDCHPKTYTVLNTVLSRKYFWKWCEGKFFYKTTEILPVKVQFLINPRTNEPIKLKPIRKFNNITAQEMIMFLDMHNMCMAELLNTISSEIEADSTQLN